MRNNKEGNGGKVMNKKNRRFLSGAASFYIVAFSTLILVIIAASFATIVISQVARASNDDLSQSAYDAALAGVEDAKLAYSNYRRCKAKGVTATEPNGDGEITCGEIVWLMENLDSCDMVGLMIGRISEGDWYTAWKNDGKIDGEEFNGEVLVSDTTTKDGSDGATSNLNQAYTCVKINTVLNDYRAGLTTSSQTKMVKVEFDDANAAKSVKSIKFSWYEPRKGEVLNYRNFSGGRVLFQPLLTAEVSTPPTVSLQLIQTSDTFQVGTFEQTAENRTNRATLFFVPTNNENAAKSNKGSISSSEVTAQTYLGIYDDESKKNNVSASQVVKTNDRYTKNLPFLTYCDEKTSDEFYCSVTIELPKPYVGPGSGDSGERNSGTFMFFVNIPYGEPDTNFAIEFHCDGDCPGNDGKTLADKTVAQFKGVQIEIDSTGRANDLYRRVDTRLEATDTAFAYPYYVIQLLGGSNNGGAGINKNLIVTKQWW